MVVRHCTPHKWDDADIYNLILSIEEGNRRELVLKISGNRFGEALVKNQHLKQARKKKHQFEPHAS